MAISLPNLTVKTHQGASTVGFTYETTGDPGQFEVGLFRSADETFDAGDEPLGGRQTITPTGGVETGSMSLPNPLPPDPQNRAFILVVADPDDAIAEQDQHPFNEGNRSRRVRSL